MSADKKPAHVLLSSTLSTTIVSALTNPLDVIKVRIQNSSKNCNVIETQCVSHTHTHNHTHVPRHTYDSLRQASLYRLLKTPNLRDQYSIFCDCLPFRTTTKAFVYLIRKEGFRTLMNGLGQGLIGAIISTVTYFSCYEAVRKEVKQITSHPIGIPLLTALTARTITTCIVFPFEYWRTLQQSVVGPSGKSGVKLEMKINSGFFSLLQRDLLFSGLYWVLVENIRRKVKTLRHQNGEGYADKKSLLLSNILAGGISGAISATVTLPLDIVKTRRQLNPEEYKNKSTPSILREIYDKEGAHGLRSGMRQRVTKVTMACAGTLTLYEFFSDVLRDRSEEKILAKS